MEAARAGLSALGIADHDTVAGVPEAIAAGEKTGVEIIPSVEINTEYERHEVHLLAYFTVAEDRDFCLLLEALRQSRHDRLDLMVSRLAALGMQIDASRVREIAGDAAPGRPHVAQALMEKRYVSDIREAFDRYLSIGKPGYVERYKLSPAEAVKAVLAAGGVPVLAHPALTGRPELVGELAQSGLMGVEVFHPDQGFDVQVQLLREASALGLLVTGGSDSHGPRMLHAGSIGEVRVPYGRVAELKEAAAKQRDAYWNRASLPLI